MVDNAAHHDRVTFAGARGIVLAGDLWEPDEPPAGTALFLHGGGQTRHSWSRTARRLAGWNWRAITLDARGHGESGWSPNGEYTVDDLVSDLYSIVDELGAPPVVVGASMGGRTALVAEGERPGSLAGLVLVDIAPRLNPIGQARVRAFMTAAPDGFSSLAEVSAAVHAYNPRRRPANPENLKKNLRLREDGRWHWHWDPGFARFTDNPSNISADRMIHAAQAVTVPTLIVRGSQSDMVTAEAAHELRQLIPRARLIEVPAGHMIAGDDNDVFTREVQEFLTKVRGGVRSDGFAW